MTAWCCQLGLKNGIRETKERFCCVYYVYVFLPPSCFFEDVSLSLVSPSFWEILVEISLKSQEQKRLCYYRDVIYLSLSVYLFIYLPTYLPICLSLIHLSPIIYLSDRNDIKYNVNHVKVYVFIFCIGYQKSWTHSGDTFICRPSQCTL